MGIVILDGTEKDSHIGNTITKLLEAKDKRVTYYRLEDMKIKPCISCGACGVRAPGECILNDDMIDIYKSIAKCHVLMMITPIRFGGYSFCLKKAVDRFMPLSLPLYKVEKGNLLHPMRYKNKSLIGIGIVEQNIEGEKEAFKRLVKRNAINFQYKHRAITINPLKDIEKIKEDVLLSIKEVINYG
ncbi:flavodoxin family protein [Dethiothermospora halolimnae]|uniref:flavodoxin family protein n=1 Tax=Dethiothermospora halolimnae TaxID=3114390 RepID=UPI003CCBCC8B